MTTLHILIAVLLLLAVHSVVPEPKTLTLTGGHLQLTTVPTIKGDYLPFETQYYFDKVVDRKIRHLVGKSSTPSVPIQVIMADLKKEEYHL